MFGWSNWFMSIISLRMSSLLSRSARFRLAITFDRDRCRVMAHALKAKGRLPSSVVPLKKGYFTNDSLFYFYIICSLPRWRDWNFNTQAVGMDSGVQFSLSNFIEDILQPNKFQNVTNVKFSSLALIFNSKFDHKLFSSLKLT